MLVAGVGNVFLGDDGFGPEVVRRLADGPLPDRVRLRDYGLGGVHLAFDLLDGYDTLVIVDAVPRGGEPGSICVLEVTAEHVAEAPLDGHAMDPAAVLGSLARLGGHLPVTFVVGCEPAATAERIGLSPAVAAAVDVAAAAVRDLLAERCGGAARSGPKGG